MSDAIQQQVVRAIGWLKSGEAEQRFQVLASIQHAALRESYDCMAPTVDFILNIGFHLIRRRLSTGLAASLCRHLG